ncbi:barstar family protein [Shewanella woodyi]|uniref:barstar family protein n=1 Tax=Shewanella woodyi TaxID=60961 RepID=UPI0007F86C16|nr:barstar family protein [Shewanella woodyi]
MKINVTNIETEKDLHKLLAIELSFPDFYGNNWNAFWDSITGLVQMPSEIEFVGSCNMQQALPDSYFHLKQCLQRLNEQYPEIGCKVTWC